MKKSKNMMSIRLLNIQFFNLKNIKNLILNFLQHINMMSKQSFQMPKKLHHVGKIGYFIKVVLIK